MSFSFASAKPNFSIDPFAIQRGLVPGARLVHRVSLGTIPTAVARSAWHDSVTGNQPLRETVSALEIVSSSASDDGSPAGVGLQTVLVRGVKADLTALEQTVTMNGTGAVALSALMMRVNELVPVTVGSSETNVGAVDVRTVSGSTVQLRMPALYCKESALRYTVPFEKRAFILDWEFTASGNDADKAVAQNHVNFQIWRGMLKDGYASAADVIYQQDERAVSYYNVPHKPRLLVPYELPPGCTFDPIIQNATGLTATWTGKVLIAEFVK